LIVGAGPAGLEAARVSALNGHEVEIFEKRERIGGQLIEAAAASYKKEHIEPLMTYYENQLKKLGIKLNLGIEIGPQDITKNKPDIVVIATGATPVVPDIPGVNAKNVFLAMDYLASEQSDYFNSKNIKKINITGSKKICVIGGGEVGLEAAYILGKKGHKVTVVEMAEELFKDLNLLQIEYAKERIKEAGTNVIKNHKVKEIKDGKVLIEDSKFESNEIEADIVMIAVGSRTNEKLVKELEGKVPEIKVIGDCVKVARIIDAVHDGFNVVYQFSKTYENITLPFI
jgi:2-enoate reductase